MTRPRKPRRPLRSVLALAVAVSLVSATSACFAEPSPLPTIRNFLVAWNSGDYVDAAKQTTGDRETVAAELGGLRDQLDAASLDFALGHIRQDGANATAEFQIKVDLGDNGQPWDYGSQMKVRRTGRDWEVVWSPSIIHPQLRQGQRLAIVTESSQRAAIQDARGHSLLRKAKVEVFGVVPGKLRDPEKTLSELAKLTDLDLDRLIGRERSAPPQSFLPLVTLKYSRRNKTEAKLRRIDGVRSHVVAKPVTPALAAELVGKVGSATAVRLQRVGAPYQPGDTIGISGLQLLYQRRLAGIPTVKVVAQDPSGEHTSVLAEWRGTPSVPVRTTLDRRVQRAAQRALRGLRTPASLVAVHAATGEILADANHRTEGKNLALQGRYPPGMTFSLVSTQALLRHNQSLTERVACPHTTNVAGQPIRNTGGTAKTFRTNFAVSCSTAFASLAHVLTDKDLPSSALRFGIGGSWELPVPSFVGSVPDTNSEGERAVAMVGQGKVRVSPLVMALAAGAVDSGTWRPPQLLNDPRPKRSVRAKPLEPTPILALKNMMRRSVTKGTAQAANLPGTPVAGVAAKVHYRSGHKTVSWFVGYRGDIAFAIAVQDKVNAAKVARWFLRRL